MLKTLSDFPADINFSFMAAPILNAAVIIPAENNIQLSGLGRISYLPGIKSFAD